MDESELRSALVALARRAPDPAPAVAQAEARVAHIRARRRRFGLAGVAAAVVVAAGASVLIAGVGAGPSEPAAPSTPPTPSISAVSSPESAGPAPVSSPGGATPTNPAVAGLGITQPWTLVGYDGYALVRLALDTGTQSKTPVSVASTGPLYLLTQGDRTLVHPLDYVPAYLVVAGRQPQPSSGLFSDGGVMLPADDGRLWLEQTRNGRDQLVLFDWDGTMVGTTIDLPADPRGWPTGDGIGGALIPTAEGTLDLQPDGSVLITKGTVLAAGGGRFLTTDPCTDGACNFHIVDAKGATVSRVSLDATPFTTFGDDGVISPDGSTAALGVFSDDAQATTTIALIDCATGQTRIASAQVPLSNFFGSADMVWAPDSSRLFVAGTDGSISVVDAHTGAVDRVPGVLSASENLQLAIVEGATGTAATSTVPQTLSGYSWTSQGVAPRLPVTVPVPAGYSASRMKFYPGLSYSTVTYTSADGDPPIQVTVGTPEAFAQTTADPPGTASTSTDQTSPTTARRTVTTADRATAFVVIDSRTPGLARSLADGLSVTSSPIDLGIRLAQLPAGGYVAGAQLNPANPAALAQVDVVWPSSDQTGGTTDATLTLRDAARLAAVVGSTVVRTLDGRFVTVYVGADTTSWVLLRDGRAIVLTGYPLSGTMLRDALAHPDSTLLPLLAGATAPN